MSSGSDTATACEANAPWARCNAAPIKSSMVFTARCAGKGKYFAVVDAIFHSQAEMFQTGDIRGVMLRVAKSAGLSEQQFDTCVSDEKALNALNTRFETAARKDNISGTPTFIMNGKQIASGEVSIQQLEAAVAEAEAAAK